MSVSVFTLEHRGTKRQVGRYHAVQRGSLSQEYEGVNRASIHRVGNRLPNVLVRDQVHVEDKEPDLRARSVLHGKPEACLTALEVRKVDRRDRPERDVDGLRVHRDLHQPVDAGLRELLRVGLHLGRRFVRRALHPAAGLASSRHLAVVPDDVAGLAAARAEGRAHRQRVAFDVAPRLVHAPERVAEDRAEGVGDPPLPPRREVAPDAHVVDDEHVDERHARLVTWRQYASQPACAAARRSSIERSQIGIRRCVSLERGAVL